MDYVNMYARLMYDMCLICCYGSLPYVRTVILNVNDNARLNACVLFVVCLLPLPSSPIERIRVKHQNA